MKTISIHKLIRKSLLIAAAFGATIVLSPSAVTADDGLVPALIAQQSKLLSSHFVPKSGAFPTPGNRELPNSLELRFSKASSQLVSSRLGIATSSQPVSVAQNTSSTKRRHTAKPHLYF